MNGKKQPVEFTPREQPTLLHCFCTECNQIVLEQERVPNDVLEMSFYKLIEQFFYNKKISVSASRVQEPLAGEPKCPHSLFKYCELIFRFGTIKTTIKFEK